MREIKKQKVVQFDSLNELKAFVANLGNAQFYDAYEGEYIPIRIDDDSDKLVLGSDAWEDVEERHLTDIYGYITIREGE